MSPSNLRRPHLPHASQKRPSSLCIFHAREEQQLLESEKLAAEFASLSGKLNTVTGINHVLGKVFIALAEKRISHQTAETFGYLGQLLLQSISGVKSELNAAVQHPGAYDAMLRHNIPFFRPFRNNDVNYRFFPNSLASHWWRVRNTSTPVTLTNRKFAAYCQSSRISVRGRVDGGRCSATNKR